VMSNGCLGVSHSAPGLQINSGERSVRLRTRFVETARAVTHRGRKPQPTTRSRSLPARAARSKDAMHRAERQRARAHRA
jgi:hypothetical protein